MDVILKQQGLKGGGACLIPEKTMKLEVKTRERDVAEAPMLRLDVEEETGTWVLSAAYYFTSDYSYAIKTFADSYGYFAEQVPFHAWENIYKDIIRIIEEELDTYTNLIFRLEANEKSTYYLAEKIVKVIQQKYPDLFQ